MDFISSIFSFVSAIVTRIARAIAKFVQQALPLLIVLAVIFLAPMVAGYLTTLGAPGFLVTAFEAIGTLSPYVASIASFVTSGVAMVGASAWTAFSGLSLGTQIAVGFGVGALIAPDEAAEVVESAVEAVMTVATTAASAIGGAAGSLFAPVLIFVGAYLLLSKGNSNNGNKT